MNFVVKPIVGLLAFSLIFTGIGVNANRGTIARAAEPPPATPLPPGDGPTLLAQGRAQLKRGSADQALVSLNQALQVFTGANDGKGQAATHDALGDLYSRQGQYAVALSHYQDANRAFVSASDTYNGNLMLAKIGDMYYSQGDLTNARGSYMQMSVTKPETNTVKQTQQKVGKAGGLFGKVKGAASGGGVSGATGAVSAANDVKNIVDQERQAYRQFIIYSIYEVGLGKLDSSNNQADSAQTHFNNALSAADNPIYGKFGQAARWRVAARTGLGDVALSQSRYPDAIKLYTAAADGARKDKRVDMVWPAQRGIGRSLWAQAAQESDPSRAAKDREDSIASYRSALQTIETLRSGSIGSDESRTTFLASTADVYNEAASALAERALLTGGGASLSGPALNDASEAFKIVEESRARSLLDMLGESGSDLTEGVPADLVQKKKDNLARQQEIAEVLTGASLNPDAQKKSTADLEKELDGLQTDYDQIENQIRTASPRYSSLTKPQPLTLAEVQQQVLDDKTALLTYSLGQPNSYLFAVTQGGVSLYKLPARDTIDDQAFALRAQLIPARLRAPIAGINLPPTRGLGLTGSQATGPAAEYAKAANALYSTVVAPAASVVGNDRLLVVADGALNYIPFEALVTAPGGSDYSTLPYLIKTNEIVYAPSASVVSVIRKTEVKPTGKSVLLVADPVFNSNDPRAKGAVATIAGGGDTRGLGLSSALTDVAGTPVATNTGPAQGLMLARLNGTRTEAEQIAALTKTSGGQAETLLDLNANEGDLESRDLKSYRVLHIATHGLLDAQRPQFSGVVLSLVGNKTGDGFLRTDEIFNLKLGSPLVMLSACETGLGKEKRGEGVIGLTRAFMYAGAPTVGVSLWSVSDASTALLMTDFYKRLLTGAGMPPSSAMRAAQQNMIAGKKYSAPFYWAPFVLVGEWR